MRLSVCMATYQGERYVKEQLESILAQLGPDDEVIVSDDGSSDATVAVVEALSDERIKVYRSATNLGYTKNFESALRRASGDLIFVADQDDVWLPGKVSTMVEALRTHDLVVSDVAVVDGELDEVHPSHFLQYGVRRGFVHNFLRTRYIGAAMAMRRSVRDLVLPIPARSDLCAYDYWITVVAELYFDVALVERPLMLYRRHGATASTGGDGSVYPIAHRVKVRVYCLLRLLTRAPRAIRTRRTASPQGVAEA